MNGMHLREKLGQETSTNSFGLYPLSHIVNTNKIPAIICYVVFIAFNIKHCSILPLMALNSLYCADVPLSNYSLTPTPTPPRQRLQNYYEHPTVRPRFFISPSPPPRGLPVRRRFKLRFDCNSTALYDHSTTYVTT